MIWVCSLLTSHGCYVFMHMSGVLFFLLVPHDDTHIILVLIYVLIPITNQHAPENLRAVYTITILPSNSDASSLGPLTWSQAQHDRTRSYQTFSPSSSFFPMAYPSRRIWMEPGG